MIHATLLLALAPSPLPFPGTLAQGIAVPDRDALLFDEPGDERTWARGPRWKASFGEEGLTYIPFFGSDAPQNYPVQLDLVGVSAAGEPLELNRRQRSRNGATVTLKRGQVRYGAATAVDAQGRPLNPDSPWWSTPC